MTVTGRAQALTWFVVQVCKHEGIPVSLEPPSIHRVGRWQGAAIASTSRLLLPVHVLEYQRDAKKRLKEFDYSDGRNLLSRLEQLVLAEVTNRSETLL